MTYDEVRLRFYRMDGKYIVSFPCGASRPHREEKADRYKWATVHWMNWVRGED